jgi:hypothetical protein
MPPTLITEGLRKATIRIAKSSGRWSRSSIVFVSRVTRDPLSPQPDNSGGIQAQTQRIDSHRSATWPNPAGAAHRQSCASCHATQSVENVRAGAENPSPGVARNSFCMSTTVLRYCQCRKRRRHEAFLKTWKRGRRLLERLKAGSTSDTLSGMIDNDPISVERV